MGTGANEGTRHLQPGGGITALPAPKRKVLHTIYLAGPIHGMPDDVCNGWRDEVTMAMATLADIRNPMRRDYRQVVHPNYVTLVDDDVDDIRSSTIMLVNCLYGPSWGTAMEIPYASLQGKIIIAIVPDPEHVHPWIKFHCGWLVKNVEDAILRLHRLIEQVTPYYG